ncbi:MAG TPA: hypothetical protein VKE69_07205 [Planctomycetota bacterium]|nr:hypothetical protein [Planctomycetota bacterium]
MTHVEIVIDEFVLEGFDPHDRHRIADAVERGLAESIALSGASRLSGARDLAELRAPDVRLPGGADRLSPSALGGGIARSLGSAVAGSREEAE